MVGCLAVGLVQLPARAVILLGTSDPFANTTAPTGELANSGWQYEGNFGEVLGTAIGPNHFITAGHVGGSIGDIFIFNGVTYHLTEGRQDPYTDLKIWRVDATFPLFAPLYTRQDETGQRLVVTGRGTRRGAEVIKNNTLRGWLWGGVDDVRRWGENFVTRIVRGPGPLNQLVYATFDLEGSVNEAHLSVGDSGGAVFIKDRAAWKLAGINYSVDSPIFTTNTGGGGFEGALFDARDYFHRNETNPAQYDPFNGPTGFYASRIASRVDWIYSVIDPNGDADSNGVSNVVDYALTLNLPEPLGPGAPMVAKQGASLALTFRKLVIANAPQYVVQSSSDLRLWTNAAPTESIVSTQGDVQTIKATVPATGGPFFLRVLIKPPLP